jgi:hypothetical protein
MSSVHVRTFGLLETPLRLREVAERSSLTQGASSKLLAKLRSLGLAEKPAKRNAPIVRSGTPHATLLARLLGELPRLPWDRLLVESALPVLAVLATDRPEQAPLAGKHPQWTFPEFETSWWTSGEIASAAGRSQGIVIRRLKELAEWGILRHRGRRYSLHPRHTLLREFVTSFWRHQNQRLVGGLAPGGAIVWQRGPEFIVRSDAPVADPSCQAAGPSALAEFGLPLASRDFHSIRTSRELTAGDQVILTLLCDPGSRSTIMYACLLYAKERPHDILIAGRRYGLPGPALRIRDYVASGGSSGGGPPLPKWSDLREVAAEYGVVP